MIINGIDMVSVFGNCRFCRGLGAVIASDPIRLI
jgi:hypothetical protein